MGARAPSFALALPATSVVAANAAIAFAAHGPWQPRVLVGGVELPSRASDYVVAFAHPNGDVYGSLRPVDGDWPVGALEVHARSGYGDQDLRMTVTIGPARREPPRCEFLRSPMLRMSPPLPMMNAYEYVAIGHGVVTSPLGPFVVCAVEREAGSWWRQTRSEERTLVFVDRPGTIQLRPPLPRRIVRVRFIDLAGDTLELDPPFPQE
jgi:hypothetical protein